MLRLSKVSLLVLVMVCSTLVQPMLALTAPTANAVSPGDWRAGRIIDDTVFTNRNDMSVAQIQQFLESKMPACDTYGDVGGGWRKTYDPNNPPPFTCLKDYKEVPKTSPGNWLPESNYGRTDGWAPAGSKSAAELIWDAAQAYNINPKVLLVTLQKESGLITDDWPLKRQLVYAMGAHCPDSGPGGSANCDVNYSGFSMQMRESAELFRYYLDNMDQPWWSHKKPFRVNSIRYDVEISCGSSDVLIETRATAALYTYTPYQPTPEALAAGYGSAEPCGAYGNRNFWLFYNDWFGSTLDRSFQLAKSSSSSAQYVIYNGLKQLIPSPEVKLAWGLDTTPLETVDQAYIDALTTGPNLDTVFRINSGSQLYVADSGKRYAIPSIESWKAWKLDSKAISNVPTGLGNTPANGGMLSYTVRQAGQQAVYMVDGLDATNRTILRQYLNPDVLYAIEGQDVPIITVSSAFFSTIDDNIQPALSSTKVANSGNEYQLVAGQRLYQSPVIAPLYPGVAAQVSNITISRLVASSPATPFVRASVSPSVFMVQGGARHQVTSPQILSEWMGGYYVNIVNQSYVNLITMSSDLLDTTILTDSLENNVYVMRSGIKSQLSSELKDAYKTSSSFLASDGLLGAYAQTTGTITNRFVRNAGTKQISLITNSSQLSPITDIPIAELWGVNDANTLDLPAETIDDYSTASDVLKVHVSDSTRTYALLGGGLRETTGTNGEWKLPQAQVFTDGTLASFPSNGILDVVAKDGNSYYRVIDGAAYMTTDPKIASAWNISADAINSSKLIKLHLPSLKMLTPVMRTEDQYYIANSNNILRVNNSHFANISLNSPIMSLDPQLADLPIIDWSNPLLRSSQNNNYVIDGGRLRPFNHPVIWNHWSNDGTLPVVSINNGLLSLFSYGNPIERAIKASDSTKIYSAESSTKRWITSPGAYRDLYAPYTTVTKQLLESLPNGLNIY